MDGWIAEWLAGWVDHCIYSWVDGWMDGWMDGRKDGWMGEQMKKALNDLSMRKLMYMYYSLFYFNNGIKTSPSGEGKKGKVAVNLFHCLVTRIVQRTSVVIKNVRYHYCRQHYDDRFVSKQFYGLVSINFLTQPRPARSVLDRAV